jgi:hypothetical protein
MHQRVVVFISAVIGPLAFTSCVLIKAPFQITGAVVEGTYNVTEKVVTTPFDAYERRRERKEAEEEAEKENAEKASKKQESSRQPQSSYPVSPIPTMQDEFLPLPPPELPE